MSTTNLNNLNTQTPTKRASPLRKTHSTKKAKTPSSRNHHDRFISNRSAMNLDVSNYELMRPTGSENDHDVNASPAKEEYKRSLAANLLGGEPVNKVLAFKEKAPKPAEDHQNSLRVLYTQNQEAQVKPRKFSRVIPQAPERILDAPELLDDFYLNLLDWSEGNVLGVALADEVPPILTLTLALNLNLNLALALALTLILALTLALALARSTCGTRRTPRCTSCARRPPTRTSHRSRGRSRRGPRRASWLWARPTTRCSCGTSRSSGRCAAWMGAAR